MWRVIDIDGQGRHLSLERRNVLVKAENRVLGRVPIVDLQAVIVHGTGSTISLNLAATLAEEGVPLVICAANHLPTSVTLPVSANFESAGRIRHQSSASLPLCKRLWRDVVRAKIQGQSQALRHSGHRDSAALAKYAGVVKPGDPDNIEAQAARYYWKRLMGPDFSRSSDGGGLNDSLNYGYTVLRAAVSRAIVATGLSPALGLHHRSRLNAFQLSDDLMEPFRPLIDIKVWENRKSWRNGLPKDARGQLTDLINAPIAADVGSLPLSQALFKVCGSLSSAFARERRTIWLPKNLLVVSQTDLPLSNDR